MHDHFFGRLSTPDEALEAQSANSLIALAIMEDYAADAFANREEPIPVIAISGSDSPSSDHKGKRDRLKESLSSSKDKLKEKLHETSLGSKDYGYSLQDRLFAK